MRGDVPVDNETLLMTNFMNLKIKVDSVFQMCSYEQYIRVIFIGVSAHMCISIYVSKKMLRKIRLQDPFFWMTWKHANIHKREGRIKGAR
jgi:hypothetical protein